MMTSQAKMTLIQQPYNPPQFSRNIHLAEGDRPKLRISRRRRGYRADAFQPCAQLGEPSPAARSLRVAATIFSHLFHDTLAPPPRRLRAFSSSGRVHTAMFPFEFRFLRLGLYGDVIMCEFALRTSALLADVDRIISSGVYSRKRACIAELRRGCMWMDPPSDNRTTSEVVQSASERSCRHLSAGEYIRDLVTTYNACHIPLIGPGEVNER
ncbi:hypothetical protein FB107DRAFT_255694 [Schizophyllum commune]